jgi:hypothetical protein
MDKKLLLNCNRKQTRCCIKNKIWKKIVTLLLLISPFRHSSDKPKTLSLESFNILQNSKTGFFAPQFLPNESFCVIN